MKRYNVIKTSSHFQTKEEIALITFDKVILDKVQQNIMEIRTGLAIVSDGCYGVYEQSDSSSEDFSLNERDLDRLASMFGYEKLDTSSSNAPMASYRRGAVRLNFWLTTGTVGSYLEHPRKGKTQLFRREVDINEARDIFENPRIHTGKGYRTRDGGSRGPCRFGDRCYRPDCWFDH